jgi:hypothetical protein
MPESENKRRTANAVAGSALDSARPRRDIVARIVERRTVSRNTHLAPLVLSVALGAACGSGGADVRTPEASVAETRAAQRDFRLIHRRWTTATGDERGRLEPALGAFLARYPGDRRARLCRVYLAWIHAQRGRLEAARALVDEVRRGPTGRARDFASVAEAAILLREGKPERALAVLGPLEGKIIDPEERFLYGEERVQAALFAQRDGDAMSYMVDWLAQSAPEDRDAVQGRIHELLRTLAPAAMEEALRTLIHPTAAGNPEIDAARTSLRATLADRLARSAIERKDGALARRLLDTGFEQFRRGQRGGELARVAASGTVSPRVAGRSVGLVLSVGNAQVRRRSAEAALGMARALGLPESASDKSAVQLVTSEDDGGEIGVEHALAELAGEGAAILIAAVDASQADKAARYADEASIPVILLAAGRVPDSGFAFVLGTEVESEAQALERALRARGASHFARVGAGGTSCDVEPSMAGTPRFPVQQWKRQGVDALIVLGDPLCARDAAHELAAVSKHVRVGLGLECAELLATTEIPGPRVALGAGAFPHGHAARSPEAQEKHVARTGRAPSWYTSLGYDAGVLARAALADFALEHVDDARVVAELHREAQKRLAVAEGELWTSGARGFAGKRVLDRNLEVLEPSPGERR